VSETTDERPTGGQPRHGEPADREALLAIWRDQFGGLDDLGAWVDDALGDDKETAAFVVDDEGTPVGFAVVALLDPETASRYVGGIYPPEEFPERTGVIHLLAVDDGNRDTTVGTALTEQCMDWARGETPMMLVVLWRREDHVDSSVLAEHFDYEEVARIKGYYRGRRDDCPDCGDTCICDATVHVRPLVE
jgi:GNAT superfamily N-acetyltransferase